MTIAHKIPPTATAKSHVPKYLVRETIDGQPFYYKGYREVLSGKKTLENIMGASGLQSYIVMYVLELLISIIDKTKYKVLSSELGIHIDFRNNMSGDVLIYDKSVLTANKITTKYIDIPAKIAIEVDIKIDVAKISDWEYVQQKTQKLLDFGTEKVIWIFSNTQQVMIATQNNPWLTYQWHNELEILEGITFNVGQYLDDEGVEV